MCLEDNGNMLSLKPVVSVNKQQCTRNAVEACRPPTQADTEGSLQSGQPADIPLPRNVHRAETPAPAWSS